ncbi:hypothetical protein [Melittangium boletus]|nr:hypothetical protein [Melittangium boletus]
MPPSCAPGYTPALNSGGTLETPTLVGLSANRVSYPGGLKGLVG